MASTTVHLRVGEQRRLADLQRAPIHLGQRLHFDGQRERSRRAMRRARSCRDWRAGRRCGRQAPRARCRTAPACRTSRTARSGCRRRPRRRPCSGTRGMPRCRQASDVANGRMRVHDRVRVARDSHRCRDGSAIPRTATRAPCASPSSVIATMSSGAVSAYGNPLGVTRKPSKPSRRRRALTLPDLPRLIPAAFIASAVAITALRSSCSVVIGRPCALRASGFVRARERPFALMSALGKHRRQPFLGCARDAALGDEAR